MNLEGGILAHEAAPPASEKGASRPWWESRAFVAAMILLAFIPLLYPAIPPLVDVPGHMGRYRVQLDLAHSPELQRFFTFNWRLIGNLGADLLIIPLNKLLGLEWSVKLIAMTIPPMTVAGFLWVAREIHNRIPPTAAFALPFAFSHPFLFGFLNFTLSIALALLSFGLWLRLGRLGKTQLRALLFVPISFLVFICHTFGWGTLGLLAFSAEAVRQHDRGMHWWQAAFRGALHALVMAGPIFLMLAWREGLSQGMTQDWFNWKTKVLWLAMSLRDRWMPIDIAMLAIPLAVLIMATRDQKLALSRNLAFSALVLLAGFLLLPRVIFGSSYADMRLMPFVIAVAILAIRFRVETEFAYARVLAVTGITYFVAKVMLTTASLAIAANAQNAAMAGLGKLPIGAPTVNLAGESCLMSWPLPRNLHLGAMAIVRRRAFSNDQWMTEGANLLTVKFREAAPFVADPSQIVKPNGCGNHERMEVDHALLTIPRATIDYVWTIDLPPHDPRKLSGYVPIWAGPNSTLYAAEILKGTETAQAGRRSTQP